MGLIKKKDSYFPSVWNDLFNNDWVTFPESSYNNGKFPPVNIANNEKDFTIELAAPGKKKEDFDISLDDQMLTIQSEEKASNEVNEDNYTRKEFSFSTFRRSFTLPEHVESEKIEATYKDGVLHIMIPKKLDNDKQKTKRISVS